ncbi:hypothetical protein NSA56_01605 [Oceanobacillus caeni]|uniref:hypothetical protein n=1 Tax=Oceanobacillus caeni TaxID=405946 RepID=UPI00214A8414|nr:hypothetical protein [Oceanobacillus caeni]MCR1833091.1 hypothetical protein [Oceanobacillus caeni]
MSELLTTGQMIDRLKVGEVAELEKDKRIPTNYGPSYCYVSKFGDGDIRWCKEDGTLPSSSPLSIYGHVLTWKWRILPNYVSFEEAMKALKEGKTVVLHKGTFPEITVFKHWFKLETREEITFSDLFNGKWTIAGESNE